MRRRGVSLLQRFLLAVGAAAAFGCGSSTPNWHTLADEPKTASIRTQAVAE